MKIHSLNPVFFENWDYRNSVEKGIGGSETHAVEMAWRLQRRGYDVTVYAPIPDDCPSEWRGVKWRRLQDADPNEDGLWLLYRCPEYLDKFGPIRPEQPRWFIAQDEHYQNRLTDERVAKLDKYLSLSEQHNVLTKIMHPNLGNRYAITSNGLKVDLIRKIESEGIPERNHKKLIYASSPDRGLECLLDIVTRAREWDDEIELHIYYGFDNILKLIDFKPQFKSRYEKFYERLMKSIQREGVFFHGRVSQEELYRAWMTAGIWCYPTEFFETSCITCMEAQALGAIPLYNPIGALYDNVDSGIAIEGYPYTDPLTRARYVGELLRLATLPELQEKIRPAMMDRAREFFNWERWVDQWDNRLHGINGWYPAHYQFQRKHMQGKALNIGCSNDMWDFKSLGAVNLDIRVDCPVGGIINKPDVIADAREPLPLEAEFDSVIIGDMLEHMSEDDAVKVLRNAKAVLSNGGPIIITCPDDGNRSPQEQNHSSYPVTGEERYADGIYAYHTRSITKEDLNRIIERAGLKAELWQEIDYTYFAGWGVICR